MKDAPIQIRNPEVVRDIRELAERTGLPLTEAIADAVRRRLAEEQAKDHARIAERRQAIDEILARVDKLPRIGPPLTDDDLYDEDGLPK